MGFSIRPAEAKLDPFPISSFDQAMAILNLSHASALGSGSDLWVLPQVEISQWARKVDWYLNFQISRARNHTPRQPDSELRAIMDENHLPYQDHSNPERSQPLLIASHTHLPNQLTLELPVQNKPTAWVQSIHGHWDSLKRPTLRVFLPPAIGPEDFTKLWPEPQTSLDITLVTETNSGNN